jgi:hypothetical protein
MPSTHRFQSRLFQTLQAKFYQLQDRVQLQWRQLKVATDWGAQFSLHSFQVALQASRRSRRSLQQRVARGMRSLSVGLGLAASTPIDQPIQNVLAALNIQALPAPNCLEKDAQTLVLPTETTQWQLSIQPVATQKLSLVEKCGQLWQKWRGATQRMETAYSPSSGSDLARTPGAKLAPIVIQGVASSLAHQRLVLVASGNRVLDILTAEQQQQLRQRIIFEIAVALSMQRRLGTSLPSLPSQTLSQITPLAFLKGAWRQIFQSARSTLLSPAVRLLLPGSRNFASLSSIRIGLTQKRSPNSLKNEAFGVLPFLRGARGDQGLQLQIRESYRNLSKSNLSSHLNALRGTIFGAISAIALAPFTLALPASATTAPALPQPLPSAPVSVEWIADPVRTRKQWLKSLALFGQSKPIQGKIRLVPEKAPAAISSEQFHGAIADWAYRFSQTVPSSGSPPIDVDAAFMGYHLHPLQRLLLVFDQIMVWLEAWILWLWQRGKLVFQRLFF